MIPKRTGSTWRVGPDGVVVPRRDGAVVDLRFDGHHVWSIRPDRDADRRGVVAWPPVLRPHLDGRTRWSVHDHATGREYASGDAVLGDPERRIQVLDGDGERLAVNKRGLLRRMFGTADDQARGEAVDALNALVADLREHAGVEAFACCGTLLGTIREGRLIGHDNDTDVVVLSRSRYPVDVAMESYRCERVLRDRGWRLTRTSAGNVKVHLVLSNGMEPATDVFSAWHVDDVLHMMPSTIAPVSRDALLPVGTARLEGREVIVPRDPERLLEAIYGDGWRVPDPTFRYERPATTIRRFTGWMRGDHAGQRGWENRYLAGYGKAAERGPSSLARWVLDRSDAGLPIVELGCGAGRDAVWFARQGRAVTAVDHVRRALAITQRRAARAGASVRTRHLSLCDTRTVLRLAAGLAHERRPRDVYARGLLESLAPGGRSNLWLLARMAQRLGGRTYLGLDPRPDVGRLVDLDTIVHEIEAAGGTVEMAEPVMSRSEGRIVVRWTEGGEVDDRPVAESRTVGASRGGP